MIDKKRLSGLGHEPHSSMSASTAFSLYPSSSRLHNQRDPSPPASTYFSNRDPDPLDVRAPLPSDDAPAHFAYSTSLRRHSLEMQGFGLQSPSFSALGDISGADGRGFLRKVLDIVRTRSWTLVPQADPESERHSSKSTRATPAAQFAHFTVEETTTHFQTSRTHGLAAHAIASLRALHGYNEFAVPTPDPLLLKFAKTIYESPLILLLFGSAIISALMGNVDDAVSIGLAILIVLTVGFVQERRSEKSLEALTKLVPHHCHLIRDGRPSHVLANELVPGDVVTFSVGDRIPADVRLLEAVDLEVDESSLTGETRAVTKDVAPLSPAPPGAPEAGLADRTCIAYMGTLVRNGRGVGLVVATGSLTEFGVIFAMMQDVEEKRTPLQLSMDELAKRLSLVSFAIIGCICLMGWWQGRTWLSMFTIGVSLAVAAIPEGLPIVTTVTLALGVLRMAKRKAIVKKLPSVEALGSVSVICSDKTGTLTKNEMTVMEAYTVDELVQTDGITPPLNVSPALRRTLEIGCICNNAFRNDDGVTVGQSTDVALLNAATFFSCPDQRAMFSRMSERPFNSEQKYMAVSGRYIGPDAREVFYMKGSIEAVLERCRFYYISDDATPALDGATRARVLAKADGVAARGLRVIAAAYGYGSVDAQDATAKPGLVFAGFAAMRDPPRAGIAGAIARLHAGGVHVVMITGDAPATALAIARELGLRGHSALTGPEIDALGPARLREAVGAVSVFARTTPRHKMAIVEAFQARGAVVAMTGDGVNDAPALKMADIGISMGKSGTDVAKEAADVILVDDNFATILSAIEEGKGIFHNIQNFLSFQLSTAVAALSLITLSTIFDLHNPLNAMQILFINILMDGPPSQSLGVDPVDPAVMRRPPRGKDEQIVTKRLLARVLFSASLIVCGTLFVYAYELSDGHTPRDQTMTFTCFVFLDLVSALQNRGLSCGILQNRMLLTTVSVSFCVALALVYVPFMQLIFQTESLLLRDLLHLLALAATAFALHEARRRFERRLGAGVTTFARLDEMA